jgi:pimeloyl-ACP methyl ester carboxylesterase
MRGVVELDGLDVAYERVGEGPALVLLHGYVGDGPTTWRRQLEALADDFTVVAWDAPGAGRSSDPPERFGIAGYADCVAQFVAALDLRRPHVAGLSFGGIVALELCRRHPNLPRTLILASAYAGWAGSLPEDAAAQRLSQALFLSELSAEQFVATLLPTMFSEGTSQETIDEFGASIQAFHPIGFRAMARASAEDVRDALGLVAVPTLLLYGDRDVRAPLSVAAQLHDAIDESKLIVLPDAGHVCNVEASDAFNQAVLAFLRQHDQ